MEKLRGVILAGGLGTRLLPITRQQNKHMLGILNNPMILYPLETLKSLGITDIIIISGGGHIGDIADFFGDGSEYGVNLTYRAQKEAGGIAQALGLASDFAHGEQVAVILGDNIFENDAVQNIELSPGVAHIFAKKVTDPDRFGVVTWEAVVGEAFHIEEKPKSPQTNLAVTGLYVYPPEVFDVIPTLEPSNRREFEITDVNNYFTTKRKCTLHVIDGFWSDAGTPESLYRAIKYIAKKNGLSTE